MSDEIELPEDYMQPPRDARIVYIQKEGNASRELNKLVLGFAATFGLMALGIGAWGVSALVNTREEVAGMRTELRIMNERLARLEQRPQP